MPVNNVHKYWPLVTGGPGGEIGEHRGGDRL